MPKGKYRKNRSPATLATAWVVVVAVAVVLPAVPCAAETAVWKDRPISIDLVVAKERLIEFPAPLSMGLSPYLADERVLSKVIIGNIVYLTAKTAFAKERAKIRLSDGRYILVDLTARPGGSPDEPAEEFRIVLPPERSTAGPKGRTEHRESAPADATGSLFELIRYAAQNVYAPPRLVAPVADVRKVSLGTVKNARMDKLYDNARHPGLRIYTHEGWSAGNLYVTSFIVENHHTHEMVLDRRKVKHAANARRTGVDPHFIASAFFSPRLNRRGESGSRTVLFVVTDMPFQRVVQIKPDWEPTRGSK